MKSLIAGLVFTFIAMSAAAQCGTCDPYSDPFCTCDPFTGICNLDPIMINLSGGVWHLTGLDDPVMFDIQVNKKPQAVGWTAGDSGIAFLVIDLNHDGIVDDASELFGNATRLRDGSIARNGFAALAQYDSNNDGIIDARDEVWPKLLLWTDRNHDGFSQPDELMPLSASPISALELGHHWTGRMDASGNRFGYEGVLHRGNRRQSFYDVFLVTSRPSASVDLSQPSILSHREVVRHSALRSLVKHTSLHEIACILRQ